MAYERVHTVWDYWDGARSGIANFSGRPHYYCCEWCDEADDYTDVFLLTPIDEETLALALEQWSIWRQWELAFHRGEVALDTHPMLPGQHPRYAELDALLKARTSNLSGALTRKHATFRARQNQAALPRGVMRELEVEWSDATK